MYPDIERLSLNDYEECLHFLKLAFNEYDHWVDFDRELPKAFRPRQDLMEQNLVIRDGKRILALVGVYPMDLNVNGQIIKCSTIGNVATHPEERGKGYMKALFTEAVKESDRMGIQMNRLGGLRQRYNRYGFECGGEAYRYEFTSRNAEMYQQTCQAAKLSFVPLNEEKPELVSAAFSLYQSSDCRVDRLDEETFLCVLRAHYMQPWAALDEEGRFAGYLTASENHKLINEQYTVPGIKAIDMDCRWLEQQQISVVKPYSKRWDKDNLLLGRWAEGTELCYPSQFRIRDWEGVIRPFLQYKLGYSALPEGKLLLGIENEGTFALTVSGDSADCRRTEEAPELTVDRFTATRLLFGMMAPELTVDVNPQLTGKLNAWLPLPLSWSCQDNV